MAEVYNDYLKQRLLDFALGKTKPCKNGNDTIPVSDISPIDDHEKRTFKVSSSTGEVTSYKVDLTGGMRTCPVALTGKTCKHQIACSDYNSCYCPTQRKHLAVVAVGEEVPGEEFFENLNETKDACNCKFIPIRMTQS